MSLTETDSYPRAEPLLLKPTTLPHGVLDAGAAGERIEPLKPTSVGIGGTPSPSTTELIANLSQTNQIHDHDVSPFTTIFLTSLRIIFYLVVLLVTTGLTLAACKFTDMWDPCGHLFINTTECKVTSYMKGMIYYTDCTESSYCVLPGFENSLKRQGWSIYKPDETTA